MKDMKKPIRDYKDSDTWGAFLDSVKECFLFRSETTSPRWAEIGLGVVAWVGTVIIIVAIYLWITAA